jgi:hypothetical protein
MRTGLTYSPNADELPCPECGSRVAYEYGARGKRRRDRYGTCTGRGLLLTPSFVDGAWMGRFWAEGFAWESFAEFVTRRARELRELSTDNSGRRELRARE